MRWTRPVETGIQQPKRASDRQMGQHLGETHNRIGDISSQQYGGFYYHPQTRIMSYKSGKRPFLYKEEQAF